MEVIFIVITIIVGAGLFIAVNAEAVSGRRAAIIFLLVTWLMLGILSLFFLPWAYAQPNLYFKAEAEYARVVAEQARSVFSSSIARDVTNLVTVVLSGFPLTFLSSLGLFMTLFDSYALLVLAAIGFLGLLLMIANLAFLRSQVVSLVIIVINSALIVALLSLLPSLDQVGTLGNPTANFLAALLGTTYGNGFVFALLILVAFNALHASWLSDQMSILSAARMRTASSRFSASAPRSGASIFSPAGVSRRSSVRRPTISAPIAILLLFTGVVLMLSALFLPLISHSPVACLRNMTSLNRVLTELQRLTTELPADVRINLAFIPSSIGNPQDLFTSTQHKMLVGALCTKEIWAHSWWFLQNGGGAWQLTLPLTILLGILLIVAGVSRITAMPLSIAITFLSLVALLALTHALATIETFGYHDDFSLRVVAILGATQPSLGIWIPVLIVAVVLPILLPFYLRESRVL